MDLLRPLPAHADAVSGMQAIYVTRIEANV